MTTKLTTNNEARNQSWSRFYRIGAITAFLTVLVMVSEIVITFLPGGGRVAPEDVTILTWFKQFQDNWFSAFAISVHQHIDRLFFFPLRSHYSGLEPPTNHGQPWR
jgi:hypothetical protein